MKTMTLEELEERELADLEWFTYCNESSCFSEAQNYLKFLFEPHSPHELMCNPMD